LFEQTFYLIFEMGSWVLNEVVPPGDPIPGVFEKVHIRAQNYRLNFTFLSADMLTSFNKISAMLKCDVCR
jgi:hypothetical protein